MATILQLLNSLEEMITFFKDCPIDIIERTKQIRTEAIEKFETNPTLQVVSELIELLKEQMELCRTELSRPIERDEGFMFPSLTGLLEPDIPPEVNSIADDESILNERFEVDELILTSLVKAYEKLLKFRREPFRSNKLKDIELLTLLHFLKFNSLYITDLWNRREIVEFKRKFKISSLNINERINSLYRLIRAYLFGDGTDGYNFYFSYSFNNNQYRNIAIPNGFKITRLRSSIPKPTSRLARRLKYYLKYLIYKQKYLNLKNELKN